MAKQPRVWSGSQWEPLAVTLPDLSNYSTTTQMNTAVDAAKGLVLVSSTTIGTGVSSITVNNCFSSTYDNYRIIWSGGTCSNSPATDVTLKFGSATTNYGYALYYYTYAGGSGYLASSSTSSFAYNTFVATTNGLVGSADVQTPYLAKNTFVSGVRANYSSFAWFSGTLADTNSYTSFTLTPVAGTITGGTLSVYGYK